MYSAFKFILKIKKTLEYLISHVATIDIIFKGYATHPCSFGEFTFTLFLFLPVRFHASSWCGWDRQAPAKHLLLQEEPGCLRKDLYPGSAANLPWALSRLLALLGLPGPLLRMTGPAHLLHRGTSMLFKHV